ncbi:DUF7504 family protein [Natronorarus salvus]|uniref:DUF7504 family protein n=1 Tax=Natronorarus salvus TaxID=3117733 RepID=UPI002F267A8B
MARDSTSEPTPAEVLSFTRALRTLKREGCSLLVVGRVSSDLHERFSFRMLGDVEHEVRRRLVVLTDGRYGSVERRLPRACQGPVTETARVVLYEPETRGVTTTATRRVAPCPTTTAEGDLGDLGETVARELDRLEVVSNGLEPAELRICLDSLDTLLATEPPEVVFRFVHLLSTMATSRVGICHVHLHESIDHRYARELAPLFDATVELSEVGGEPRQRWHLREEALSSAWLPFD